MTINSQHVTGFVCGLGAAALGLYLYKKNQSKVDKFLRSQGIKIAETPAKNYGVMTLEELVTEKERLEDLIAEREAGSAQAE